MGRVRPLDQSGLWREIRGETAGPPRPALFLDRDGTLIHLVPWLCRADGVRPVPGALATLARAARRTLRIVIVSNQSGIGRGYYGWDGFAATQDRLLALILEAGGRIDGVYACPALPRSGAPCRKPAPGMLLAAARDLAIDLRRSWIVGDSATDLEAGRRAGCAQGWLVPTGYGERDRAAAGRMAGADFPVTRGRPIAALGAALESTRL